MRPVIVEYLNGLFHTRAFNWLVPELAFVYFLAMMAVLYFYIRRVRLSGLSEYHAWGAAIWAGLAGMIGLRVWYLLVHSGQFFRHPEMILDLNGGTISFGGYFFGFAAFAYYLSKHGQNVLAYSDILASALGLGPMIGRWSCFLNGDDYGVLTSLPWGVVYPPGSYPFADHLSQGWIQVMADHSLPVHPVQIYLSIKGLVLFAVCSWLWKRKMHPPGMLFGIYWLLYATLRFGLEFFRVDPSAGYWGPFSYGQFLCMIIWGVALGYLIVLRKFRKHALYQKT